MCHTTQDCSTIDNGWKIGVVLKKYTNGVPHKRLFWCSPDLTRLYWGKSTSEPPRGSIRINEIVALRHGETCIVIMRSSQRVLTVCGTGSASAVDKQKSLTIHERRTITELEAPSTDKAVEFMSQLQDIIDFRRSAGLDS